MIYEYTVWLIHLPTHYVTIKQTDPQNPIKLYIQSKYWERNGKFVFLVHM